MLRKGDLIVSVICWLVRFTLKICFFKSELRAFPWFQCSLLSTWVSALINHLIDSWSLFFSSILLRPFLCDQSDVERSVSMEKIHNPYSFAIMFRWTSLITGPGFCHDYVSDFWRSSDHWRHLSESDCFWVVPLSNWFLCLNWKNGWDVRLEKQKIKVV